MNQENKLRHNTEILQIAEGIAREKNINLNSVIGAIESALTKAAEIKYGEDLHIKSEIDYKTGEIKVFRLFEVVESVQEPRTQIQSQMPEAINQKAKMGEFVKEQLPDIDISRIAAQSAKSIIHQKIKEAENEKQYEEYKQKEGETIIGTVKKTEFGNTILSLAYGDALLKYDQSIPNETFRIGERVKCLIKEVEKREKGMQILLSRSDNGLLHDLMKGEIREIQEGTISIKAIARDPGSKSKVAVVSHDKNVDCLGSCVGIRGNRIKAIMNEISGEKIDIIIWSEYPAEFIANALVPAEIEKIVVYEHDKQVDAIVKDDMLSIAIGRNGQNIKLASQLTGWKIDVLSVTEYENNHQFQIKRAVSTFEKELDLDQIIAQLLVAEKCYTIEDILDLTNDQIESIQGFDSELAKEILTRAQDAYNMEKESIDKLIEKDKIDPMILELPFVNLATLKILSESEMRTIQDVANHDKENLYDKLKELLCKNETAKIHKKAIAIIREMNKIAEQNSKAVETVEEENEAPKQVIKTQTKDPEG
tara:strand:+ start:1064 stop:2671 length:1608 start_codon:yes stop_codon:yes gene_type:complete